MFRLLKIIVVLLFLQPQVSNTLVWGLYQLDKENIIEQFCINKEKPALKCNGKCHLATQLTTANPIQSEQPVQVNYIPQIQLFFQAVEQPVLVDESTLVTAQFFSELYAFEPFIKLDRPPQG